jgi:hypothetical protein
VQATIDRRVEDLREQGNKLHTAGDIEGAEAAFMEAWDLQPDNVKVCWAHPGQGWSCRCCLGLPRLGTL